MCIHRIGEVTISIDEQRAPGGKRTYKNSLLQKGEIVIAGREFMIATAGKQCIFIPVVNEHEIQNISEMIVSTLLAKGVHSIKKEGKLAVPIHVYFFTPSIKNMYDMSDNIGPRSIQIRYAAVSKKCAVMVRRDT